MQDFRCWSYCSKSQQNAHLAKKGIIKITKLREQILYFFLCTGDILTHIAEWLMSLIVFNRTYYLYHTTSSENLPHFGVFPSFENLLLFTMSIYFIVAMNNQSALKLSLPVLSFPPSRSTENTRLKIFQNSFIFKYFLPCYTVVTINNHVNNPLLPKLPLLPNFSIFRILPYLQKY